MHYDCVIGEVYVVASLHCLLTTEAGIVHDYANEITNSNYKPSCSKVTRADWPNEVTGQARCPYVRRNFPVCCSGSSIGNGSGSLQLQPRSLSYIHNNVIPSAIC